MKTADTGGLSPSEIDQCQRHLALLKRWNHAFNLTSITDDDEMWIKHVLDSVAVRPFLPEGAGRLLDVGTGGGFPGVPLAITRPESTFVLLDSNGKKIRFLTQVKIALGLKNIVPVHARVEDWTVPPEDRFNGILSRAFSSLQTLVDQTQHLLAPGGVYYALKGPDVEPIPDGWVLQQDVPLTIPGLHAVRRLVTFSRGA